jgi:integrase
VRISYKIILLFKKDTSDFYFSHLEWFVAHRKEAGVLENNKYLFEVPSKCRYIDASVVFREFSVKCGASQPHLLRTTLLRKQVATMAQLLSMNDNEMKMIAKLMGHSYTVHEQVYRQDKHLLQFNVLGKISLIG